MLADAIVKGAIILSWFVGTGIISVLIYQIPFVKKWFKEISE